MTSLLQSSKVITARDLSLGVCLSQDGRDECSRNRSSVTLRLRLRPIFQLVRLSSSRAACGFSAPQVMFRAKRSAPRRSGLARRRSSSCFSRSQAASGPPRRYRRGHDPTNVVSLGRQRGRRVAQHGMRVWFVDVRSRLSISIRAWGRSRSHSARARKPVQHRWKAPTADGQARPARRRSR